MAQGTSRESDADLIIDTEEEYGGLPQMWGKYNEDCSGDTIAIGAPLAEVGENEAAGLVEFFCDPADEDLDQDDADLILTSTEKNDWLSYPRGMAEAGSWIALGKGSTAERNPPDSFVYFIPKSSANWTGETYFVTQLSGVLAFTNGDSDLLGWDISCFANDAREARCLAGAPNADTAYEFVLP